MSGRQRYQWGLVLLVAVALIWWVLTDGVGGSEPDNEPTSPSQSTSQSPSHDFTETNTPTTDPTAGDTDPESGLPNVSASALPPEARDILELIDQGGPFEHDEDGGTFENREEILPDQDLGYYKEYTVLTPGTGGRGARRIVAGEGGQFYWTADHYRSFSRIVR